MKFAIKNMYVLFGLGQGFLIFAYVLHRYFEKNIYVLFFIGWFAILSMAFNIIFLVRKIKEMKAKSKEQDN